MEEPILEGVVEEMRVEVEPQMELAAVPV